MSTNQITYELDYVEKRSRLTTLLRWILVIPAAIVTYILLIVGEIAVIVSWFALLITGKYPAGLYNFVSGVLRNLSRTQAYALLGTDTYPTFDLGEHPEHPVRLGIAPPQESYSRLKVLLRILYIIPGYIVNYALSIVAGVCAIVAWFVIIIIGRQPKGLQDGIALGLSYYARFFGLFFLLTEVYPPISYEAGTGGGSAGATTTVAPAGGPEAPSIGV